MKPSVILSVVLAVILLALGAFLLVGLVQHDNTDQLEQNQPAQAPSSASPK